MAKLMDAREQTVKLQAGDFLVWHKQNGQISLSRGSIVICFSYGSRSNDNKVDVGGLNDLQVFGLIALIAATHGMEIKLACDNDHAMIYQLVQ